MNHKIYCNSRYSILFICIFILLSSCEKMVTVDEPLNKLTSDLVFTSDKSAISSITGLYSKILSSTSFVNSGMTIYTGMSSDEITNSVSGSNDEFSKNNLTTANNVVASNFWANGYNYIYQTNAIIEGLNNSEDVTMPTKNQLIGEAKFLRALCYFYLTNIFGDVPLVTTTSYNENSISSRSSSQIIYGQITNDLIDAKSLLVTGYPTTGKVRPNKWTATALLARVYLYQKEYAKAEQEATAIINSGTYTLTANLNNVFLGGSNEAIWQLMPNSNVTANTQNVYEGNVFIPGNGLVPQFTITNYLLGSFEMGDQRKTSWINTSLVNGTTYYYPFKYKIKTAPSITEYYMVFRLAEIYLIRAEARVQQNDLTGAQADINIIRNRASLPNINLTTQTALLNAIIHERQVELFLEWGHRFLDLKRTQTIDAVLSAAKGPNWQSTDALYPIPQTEINRNINLTQNPGY